MDKLPENKINGGDGLDSIQKEVAVLEQELELLLNSKLKYTQLNRIDEIINRLDELNPNNEHFSKESGWVDFKNNYLNTSNNTGNINSIPHKKKKLSLALCIIVSVAFVNLISVMAGINIFEPILNWTSNVLNLKTQQDYIVTEDEITIFNSISDLEKYLNEEIPTLGYLPKGFKITSIELLSTGTVNIIYEKENSMDIKFKLTPAENNFDVSIEKTYENYTKFTYNSIDFYYFNNNKWTVIEWTSNNRLCYISGVFSDDDIIKIIKNIKT